MAVEAAEAVAPIAARGVLPQIRLGFLGSRSFQAKGAAQPGWIVLDFLGFSRQLQDET